MFKFRVFFYCSQFTTIVESLLTENRVEFFTILDETGRKWSKTHKIVIKRWIFRQSSQKLSTIKSNLVYDQIFHHFIWNLKISSLVEVFDRLMKEFDKYRFFACINFRSFWIFWIYFKYLTIQTFSIESIDLKFSSLINWRNFSSSYINYN